MLSCFWPFSSRFGAFSCDTLLQVAASAINDNYCDCEDGSDEPGEECFRMFSSHDVTGFEQMVSDFTCQVRNLWCQAQEHVPAKRSAPDSLTRKFVD